MAEGDQDRRTKVSDRLLVIDKEFVMQIRRRRFCNGNGAVALPYCSRKAMARRIRCGRSVDRDSAGPAGSLIIGWLIVHGCRRSSANRSSSRTSRASTPGHRTGQASLDGGMLLLAMLVDAINPR